ncbi:ADP-ribosylglycohydrolase family protein [Vibrio lamellibrachiae]|uniref:ADP-ribosylglycohydrolase family protein n=1 Tax=Vibrio lamellibrachiae TaxID=2910253 RepID=UPI003D0E66D0
MSIQFPSDYYEKLYAGIVGKIIGVYVGRPFEGWSYEEITAQFGDINRYVHEQVGVPLIVSDDDITGTFLFAHALEDHLFRPDFSAKHIGQTWVDYLIEHQTILWWGGMGMSTEHTAWLNLKRGIEAPASGSIEQNGHAVAEQIGAQIFIDGWAMLCPAMPDKAVQLAREAGLVSHDGEAVHAACLIAAMEAQAFVEKDLNTLIDLGLSYIPSDCAISTMIADIRGWYEADPNNWRAAFELLKENYGYDKYPGNCHVMPNHGLIILSLLYAGDSFHKSMKIVNTLGWDTDCNAANVGCINGIRLGLTALDDGYDWRTPVCDRFYLPSGSSYQNVSDAVQQTDKFYRIASKLHLNEIVPRAAKFHFSLPGSLQGFMALSHQDLSPNVRLSNTGKKLTIEYAHLIKGVPARVSTATHTDREVLVKERYHTLGCPTLYSGQTVKATLSTCQSDNGQANVRFYIETYDSELSSHIIYSDDYVIDSEQKIEWIIPSVGSHLIRSIGIELFNSTDIGKSGILNLHELDWSGSPNMELMVGTEELSDFWENSWIKTTDQLRKFPNRKSVSIINNDRSDAGVFVHGSEDWTDYQCQTNLVSELKENFGLIARYRGLTRYYVLELTHDDKAQLVRYHYDERTVITEENFPWSTHTGYLFSLKVEGNHFIGHIGDQEVFNITDNDMASTFECGLVGVYNSMGPITFSGIEVKSL